MIAPQFNTTLPPKQTARILIVDDHEDNVALLQMMLSAQGYTIVTASDGLQALDLVRSAPPDLILLDVMMPRMSGYEVVEIVRSENTGGYIPIMLITAKQDLADKIKGLNVGADDFLTKPVQSAELIAKVRALLRLKQVQDELIHERNKNEMLYLVGQQLNSTLDVDQLIGETLNLMINIVGATQGSVIVQDHKRGTWRKIMARYEQAISAADDASEQVIAGGLAGLALRTGQAQLVSDTLNDDRWLPMYDDVPRVRTALSIPLMRDRVVLGVLTLTHPEPHCFNDDHLPLVMAVASQVISALHNASLYTQLKEAEAEREYFVHMLTHDLRGPLAGISGCLHLLESSAINEKDRSFVEMALRACASQEGMINDILDVYKAESGSLTLERSRFRPSDLRPPIVDQLAGIAAERRLSLLIELPDEPVIVADQDKITRVLLNLVNNALKFTRRGTITVSAYTGDDGASVFEVSDTGAGIAPADLPFVFDRFFQARQPGARRGSGLGLDFSRKVVAAHHGNIWVESEVGAGTTIRFSLPPRTIA
jgi:signal transduction histidine kinase/CheY-like chemotaxis protein